jgi:hypothetical protein
MAQNKRSAVLETLQSNLPEPRRGVRPLAPKLARNPNKEGSRSSPPGFMLLLAPRTECERQIPAGASGTKPAPYRRYDRFRRYCHPGYLG